MLLLQMKTAEPQNSSKATVQSLELLEHFHEVHIHFYCSLLSSVF